MLALATIDELEARYWRGLWCGAVEDAVADFHIDLAQFGPVQASIVCHEPEEPMLNLVLGAGRPGAVEGGHLGDAIWWARLHGVDYRVPVTPGRPAAVEAEAWLAESGHEQGASRAMLVRDASPPRTPEPARIEVIAREAEDEDISFGESMPECLQMPSWTLTFFHNLPGTEGWRCYVAAEDGETPLAHMAMLIDAEVAEIAIAPCAGEERGGEGQAALLRRCILDAAAARCEAIFAEVPHSDPEPLASRTQLRRAGFEQAFVRTEWRPPRHAVAERDLRGVWL